MRTGLFKTLRPLERKKGKSCGLIDKYPSKNMVLAAKNLDPNILEQYLKMAYFYHFWGMVLLGNLKFNIGTGVTGVPGVYLDLGGVGFFLPLLSFSPLSYLS